VGSSSRARGVTGGVAASARTDPGADTQQSPQDVIGHAMVFHWPAVRIVVFAVIIAVWLLVVWLRGRTR
jgi:hypothetical protein